MSNLSNRLNKHAPRLFAVGLGGAVGAIGRYILADIFSFLEHFPFATLIVNVGGSFLLAFIMFSLFLRAKLSPILLIGLTVGMIGSLTTFSSVVLELYHLSEQNLFLMALYF